MKKAWLCLGAMAIALLTGCGAQVQKPQVGICYRDRDANVMAPLLEEKLTACGWEVQVQDAANSQHIQDEQILALLEDNCALLVIEPVMTTTAASTVEQLRRFNVPGIFMGRAPEDGVLESWEKVCYVGCDTVQSGALQGQILLGTERAGDINGDGVVTYVLLQGPEEDVDATLRSGGCIRSMGAQSRCLRRCACDWTEASAQRACARELMGQGSEVEAVFCGSAALAQGALQAIYSAKKQPGMDIYVVGFGTDHRLTALVRKGVIAGTVAEDREALVSQITQNAGLMLENLPVERKCYVNYKVLMATDIF